MTYDLLLRFHFRQLFKQTRDTITANWYGIFTGCLVKNENFLECSSLFQKINHQFLFNSNLRYP